MFCDEPLKGSQPVLKCRNPKGHQGPHEYEITDSTLGATGKFPKGKLHEHDEGQLRMGLYLKGKAIVLDFGKQVNWIGFTPNDARELAKGLLIRADQADALPADS